MEIYFQTEQIASEYGRITGVSHGLAGPFPSRWKQMNAALHVLPSRLRSLLAAPHFRLRERSVYLRAQAVRAHDPDVAHHRGPARPGGNPFPCAGQSNSDRATDA